MKFLTLLAFLLVTPLALATTPQEAYSLMQEGKAVIVDVREEDEIEKGMIQKALWFPLSRMKNDKNWYEAFSRMTEEKMIFLYCRSGNRSGQAQELLRKRNVPSENLGGFEDLRRVLPSTK